MGKRWLIRSEICKQVRIRLKFGPGRGIRTRRTWIQRPWSYHWTIPEHWLYCGTRVRVARTVRLASRFSRFADHPYEGPGTSLINDSCAISTGLSRVPNFGAKKLDNWPGLGA